jgi:hypothetical protein
VYGERPLSVDSTIAAGARLLEADARYRYRDVRMRCPVRSDSKNFRILDGWTRSTGTALVIPDTADIPVEFSPGGS